MTSPGKNVATKERILPEELAHETAEMVEETVAMIGEVSKVLQVQRWTAQQEPFTGFRSPPGRF